MSKFKWAILIFGAVLFATAIIGTLYTGGVITLPKG